MPNTPKGGGISRKIFNFGERKKIRLILNEIRIPKEMGLIVRTAGSNKTRNDIEYDLSSLIENWDKIKETAMKIYKNLKSQAEAMQLIANPWEVEALLNGQNLIEGSEYNFAITKTEVK